MTKKTRLVPFDYLTYKAGAKAVCNDINVNQLYLFACNHQFPLIGVIDNYLVSFTKDGKSNLLHGKDLMLEIELEEKTFYVNVYENRFGFACFDSLEDAEKHKKNKLEDIGTLKVTYTDEDLIK